MIRKRPGAVIKRLLYLWQTVLELPPSQLRHLQRSQRGRRAELRHKASRFRKRSRRSDILGHALAIPGDRPHRLRRDDRKPNPRLEIAPQRQCRPRDSRVAHEVRPANENRGIRADAPIVSERITRFTGDDGRPEGRGRDGVGVEHQLCVGIPYGNEALDPSEEADDGRSLGQTGAVRKKHRRRLTAVQWIGGTRQLQSGFMSLRRISMKEENITLVNSTGVEYLCCRVCEFR